jgi:hypothetical protein
MSHRFDDASCASQVMELRVHQNLVDSVHSKANLHRGPPLPPAPGLPSCGRLHAQTVRSGDRENCLGFKAVTQPLIHRGLNVPRCKPLKRNPHQRTGACLARAVDRGLLGQAMPQCTFLEPRPCVEAAGAGRGEADR